MRFILLGLLFFFSCNLMPDFPSEPYNEYDFNNPNYVSPTIIFLEGPVDGSIINTADVQIKWTGNKDSMKFSYRFDNSFWSTYSEQDSVTLRNIVNGNHIFFVQGKYINEIQGELFKIHFESE